MRSGHKKQILWMGISILYTLFLYALFLFTFPVYFNSDNWEVAVVTAGYYGSNLCQYIHPLLCLIIGGIGKVLPSADIFTLLIHIAIALGMTLTFYLALEWFCCKNIRRSTIADWLFMVNVTLGEFFISECLRIWNANYNIQTGAILFWGIIVLFLSMYQRRGALWNAAGTGLIMFGLMLRVAVAYLFIPFLALSIITAIADARNSALFLSTSDLIRSVKKSVFPIILVSVGLMCSRAILYSVEPYKSAEIYNKNRTIVVDYPMKTWEEIIEPPFSSATYAAATDWVFIDTEGLNADKLGSIAEIGSKNQFAISDVSGILHEMWRRVAKIDIYMFLMLLGTILLGVSNLLCLQSGWRKLETVLALIGGFVILFYFTFRGRAPLRVWQPVLFATDTVLIEAAVHKTSSRIEKTVMSLGLFAVLWFGAGQVIAHNEFITPQNVLTARINVDDSVYEDTFQDGRVYIWTNWHATIPNYFMYIGKLPTQRVIDHNIAAGDWTYGQVYYKEYLERIGVPNPAEALVNKDNVYLASTDEKIVLEYLREQYGKDLDFLEVGEVNGMTAYKVIDMTD